MVKKNQNEANGASYEWEYSAPTDNRTTCEKIKNFIYNPATHAVLGKTAEGWVKVLLFYLLFYSGLALLFAICLKLMLRWISETTPTYALENSLIGTSPGLGFRPAPQEHGSTLIWYKHGENGNLKSWSDSMNEFFKSYGEGKQGNAIRCSASNLPNTLTEYCYFDVETLGKCSPKNEYGLKDNTTACVFLKLNKIFKWMPEVYESESDIPRDVGPLKEEIMKSLSDESKRNAVWVSCKGESDHDVENIGPLEYLPAPQFPGYFYPYENAKGYMTPIVAVRFKAPKRNVIIMVECRAWAKNIKYKKSGKGRSGSVHFEMMLD